MPQAPIVIPLIITGLLFGSLLKQQRKSFSKKSVAIASVSAGLLNGVHAYLLDILTPQPTIPTTFANRAGFALRATATATIPFVVSAIAVGILIVLVVVVVAAIFGRFSRGTAEEEPVPEEKVSEEILG
jgi:hypothetical protein